MIELLCPVCGRRLRRGEKTWNCDGGHAFDVARQGYVNLLPVTQKHSLHPGDTRQQVAARRAFLDRGFYLPIVRALAEETERFCPGCQAVLDVGCGEGYYLSMLPQIPQRWGVDVSKEAVRYAAAREKRACFLVATASHLPFADGSFDCLLSMFALTVVEEYRRVLKRGGVFIQVLAGENHLPRLKELIYPEVRQKEKHLHSQLAGFRLLHSRTLQFPFELSEPQEVRDLLYMTPHVWRITKEGAQRLEAVQHLQDEAQVVFNIYGRQETENLLE